MKVILSRDEVEAIIIKDIQSTFGESTSAPNIDWRYSHFSELAIDLNPSSEEE